MIQDYTNFKTEQPFTVYEKTHHGKIISYRCENTTDFINRCDKAYMHHESWHVFLTGYQSVDDKTSHVHSFLTGADWDAVRKYIEADAQWCVLINDGQHDL